LAGVNCKGQAPGKLAIEVIMFDFEGRILGRAEEPRTQ